MDLDAPSPEYTLGPNKVDAALHILDSSRLLESVGDCSAVSQKLLMDGTDRQPWTVFICFDDFFKIDIRMWNTYVIKDVLLIMHFVMKDMLIIMHFAFTEYVCS